jgi:hypothetical protein
MASPAPRLFFSCFLLAGALLYLFWPAEYETQLDGDSKAATSRLSAVTSSHPPSCRVYDNLSDPFTKEYGRTNLMLSRSYEGARRVEYGRNGSLCVPRKRSSGSKAIAKATARQIHQDCRHWRQRVCWSRKVPQSNSLSVADLTGSRSPFHSPTKTTCTHVSNTGYKRPSLQQTSSLI